MDNLTPITREEMLMNDEPLTPITREEKILAGEDLTSVTRREYFLKKYRHAGGDVMVEGLSVTENGTYTAPEGKAYSPVEVAVPLPENAYLLKEASGSLVSFSDGADLPMPSFICNIDAVQDLHGQDGPWVGGAGKNKLPNTASNATVSGVTFTVNSDGTITANGTASNLIFFQIGIYSLPTSETPISYVLSGAPSGASTSTFYIDCRRDDGSQVIDVGGGSIPFPSSGQTGKQARIIIQQGQTLNNLVFKPMIRLATETDPTFAPYSNICPISGHTGLDAWVRGKNLLENTQTTQENNGITFTVNSDGSVKANGTATADAVLSIIVDTSKVYGDLYFVGCNGGSNNTYNTLMWDATASARPKKWDGTTASNNSIDGTFQQVKIVQGNNVKFQLRVMNGQTVSNVVFYPMICLSTETDATFKPYNPNSQTIQLSWQTEAGEVFGGYVDLVSGELTVTDGYIASYNGETLPSTWISDRDAYAEGTSPTTGAEVVYKLATPQTYQLDGNQIKSLLGNNNAWCSTGDVDIDYFAKEV